MAGSPQNLTGSEGVCRERFPDSCCNPVRRTGSGEAAGSGSPVAVSHIWDKDGKRSVQEAGSWPEGWYGSFQKNRKTGCPQKGSGPSFPHQEKKFTVKGKGWKPEKTLPGNDMLGADNTQKLLYIFAVVIYFFSDFFYFI